MSELITDADGIIRILCLPAGDYAAVAFHVSTGEADVLLELENDLGIVTLQKVDAPATTPIEGTVFVIRDGAVRTEVARVR